MPKVNYIYLIRKADENIILAAFTVKRDAIAFAAVKNLLPPHYVMERLCNGTWAMPVVLREWENLIKSGEPQP